MSDFRWRCTEHLANNLREMTKYGHPVRVEVSDGPCNECGSFTGGVFKLTLMACPECHRSMGHKMDCGRRRRRA